MWLPTRNHFLSGHGTIACAVSKKENVHVLAIKQITHKSKSNDQPILNTFQQQNDMMNPSMTMNAFDTLCTEGKFEQAAELLDENVYFSNPKITCHNKAEWLVKFPPFVKTVGATTWEELTLKPSDGSSSDGSSSGGSSTFEYQRKGKTRFMGIPIRLEEDLVFDDQGKITYLKLKRA